MRIAMPAINPETGEPRLIRNPDTGFSFLPPDGASVPLTEYWINHMRDGAVIQTGGHPVEF